MTEEKITKEMNILDILEKNPSSAEILAEAGLGCLGCAFAHAETLEQGLIAHGFEPQEIDKVIEKLNE